MNLRNAQTWGRRLLWSSVFAVPLLSSCVFRQQGSGTASTGSRAVVQIQGETKWPTDGAWWAKDDAVAQRTRGVETIRSMSHFEKLRYSSDLFLASKVVDVTRTDNASARITFQLIERASTNLILIGPERLSQYVCKGQKVILTISTSGEIRAVSPFVKLVHWQHEGSLIRSKFVSSNISGHSISLLMTERELFEGYEVRNEREFRNVYYSSDGLSEQGRLIAGWSKEFEGKPYDSLSQSQKTKLLGSGTNYEISINPRGLECWSASGYGGGEENATEWVVSSPASEDFE